MINCLRKLDWKSCQPLQNLLNSLKSTNNMQEAKKLNEIIFLVEETDDGYVAQALSHSIFTQADSIEELREMVKDAVECHFDEEERPRIIRLHIVRQEVLTV